VDSFICTIDCLVAEFQRSCSTFSRPGNSHSQDHGNVQVFTKAGMLWSSAWKQLFSVEKNNNFTVGIFVGYIMQNIFSTVCNHNPVELV